MDSLVWQGLVGAHDKTWGCRRVVLLLPPNQFLGRLMMAGSDNVSSGARRRQVGQVNCRQHHISEIPVFTPLWVYYS